MHWRGPPLDTHWLLFYSPSTCTVLFIYDRLPVRHLESIFSSAVPYSSVFSNLPSPSLFRLILKPCLHRIGKRVCMLNPMELPGYSFFFISAVSDPYVSPFRFWLQLLCARRLLVARRAPLPQAVARLRGSVCCFACSNLFEIT